MSTLDIDPAFKVAGFGKTEGITKWRIENKMVVKCENVDGSFYTGDSYIVLVSKVSGTKMSHSIHFWLGSESSVDEYGIAAYKSVECDAALGGTATQYREIQGSESSLFCSSFPSGVQYLAGGVDSGFQTVVRDVWPTRLLLVKGKRNIRVFEVPVTKASLTQDDAYVLDMGLNLYIWYGPNSNKYEKAKALDLVSSINSDTRGGRAKITRVCDEEEQNEDFWGALGGYAVATSLPLGASDDTVPAYPANRLLSISEGQTSEVEVVGGKLTKEMLVESNVMLVIAQGVIYIWVGRDATMQDKKEATASASSLVQSENMPSSTSIVRVSQSNEPATFKSNFASWDPPMSFKRQTNIAGTIEEKAVDIAALLAHQAAMDKPVDDGAGKVQVWAIKDYKLDPIDAAHHGEFYGGDSYVIAYTYLVNGKERGLVYFWLGNTSTPDEKGSVALLCKEVDDKQFNGGAAQIRVTQGKEPAHFRAIFKGLMIVHEGGNASGAKNRDDVDSRDTDGTALFHVRSTNNSNACGVQVAEICASLNGEDCFVLVTPTHSYCWNGNASNDSERSSAKQIADKLANNYLGQSGRALVILSEQDNDAGFWDALGGRGEYSEYAPGAEPPRAPRLFEASTAKGAFRVEEVDNFTQDDLCNDDVYLLDTFTSLFVWVGSGATSEETTKAHEMAGNFVSNANDGRDPDMPVIQVNAGTEPIMFTQHFVPWDADFASKHSFLDPYAARVAALKEAEQKVKAAEAAAAPASDSNFKDVLGERRAALAAAEEEKRRQLLEAETSTVSKIGDPLAERRAALEAAKEKERAEILAAAEAAEAASKVAPTVFKSPSDFKFSLDDLKGRVDGVDPAKKEEYLSDAEFQSVFNCSRSDFASQPAWKTKAAKQKAGLF